MRGWVTKQATMLSLMGPEQRVPAHHPIRRIKAMADEQLEIMARHMEERAWELIGWRKLEEQFSQPIVQFMQDIGNFRDCTIFDTAGNERSAEPQECIGLERSAVWEEVGIEQRLLDSFLGRPNDAVERLKARLDQARP